MQDIGGNPNRIAYAVHGALREPDELTDKFQAFYRAAESGLSRGDHGHVEDDGVDPGDADPAGEKEEEADEARIRNVLETIESTLCTYLNDRQVDILATVDLLTWDICAGYSFHRRRMTRLTTKRFQVESLR